MILKIKAIIQNNLEIPQRRIQNLIKHPRRRFFAKTVND